MARLFFNKTNIFLSHDSQSPATATSMQQHIHSSIRCPAKTLLTLLLIAISNFAAAETRCDRPAATLESAEGAVEWTTVSTDDWQKAEAGATFCYGDKVRILEQRAALRLANDTLVRLQENSLITLLPEEKGFWFSLLEGAGHFLSRTPKQFTIKAPYLNAAVDGTEFVISAQPQENRVAVVEGAVRVSNDLGEVHLSEGTQTSATANSAPSAVQSIRLRDAAEWVLYYPPLIVQIAAPAAIETLIQQENYGAALSQLTATDLTAETAALAASLAYNTGNTAQGEQLLTQALNQSTALPETRALQALRTLIGGDSDGALVQTTQLVNTHPQNPSVLLAHAYAQQSRGKIEEALQTNLQAQALMPENLFVLARTAELQLSVGNTRAAQKLINTALKQAPQHSRLNTLAGFIALNRFATGKAQDHFQTAIASNNNEPLARLGLALAFIQKGKIEQGRAQMEMAVLLDPSSSLLRSYLGKTYAAQNQNDWADTQYQLAKNLDQNDPTPWFYQAHLKHEENKSGEALRLITTAIEKNDNRAVYRSRMLLDSDAAARSANLSVIFNSLGFTEASKNIAAMALTENPTDFASHRALVISHSDDPNAQILRARAATLAQLLSPIGAKDLNVGVGETGLPTHAWVAPGRSGMGAHEYTSLYAKNGLSGSFGTFLDTEESDGYDWQLQAIAPRTSLVGGEYRYESDGYRENNDLDINIREIALHHQLADNTKTYLGYSETKVASGELSNEITSPLFNEKIRRYKSREQFKIGVVNNFPHQSNLILIGSTSKIINKTKNELPNDPYIFDIQTEPNEHQLLAMYSKKFRDHNYYIGVYEQHYEAKGSSEIHLTLPEQPLFLIDTLPLNEKSKLRSIYAGTKFSAANFLKIKLGAGTSEIDLREDAIQKKYKNASHEIGISIAPKTHQTIDIAHWKTVASRLPDTLRAEQSNIFSIIKSEDISNFSEQSSYALKFNHHGTGYYLTSEIRKSMFTQPAMDLTTQPPSLKEEKYKVDLAKITVEHLINAKFGITAQTQYQKNELAGEPLSDNTLKSLNTFTNSIKAILYFHKSLKFSVHLNHINQEIKGISGQNNLFSKTANEIVTNASLEFNTKNQNLKINADTYNIFNQQASYRQGSLLVETEGTEKSQQLLPPTRTFIFRLLYAF